MTDLSSPAAPEPRGQRIAAVVLGTLVVLMVLAGQAVQIGQQKQIIARQDIALTFTKSEADTARTRHEALAYRIIASIDRNDRAIVENKGAIAENRDGIGHNRKSIDETRRLIDAMKPAPATPTPAKP